MDPCDPPEVAFDAGGALETGIHGSMLAINDPATLADLMRRTICALARTGGPQLTSQQLGVYLASYVPITPPDIGVMAEQLGVSVSGVMQALDRLSEFGLTGPSTSTEAGHGAVVPRTIAGAALFLEVIAAMAAASSAAGINSWSADGRGDHRGRSPVTRPSDAAPDRHVPQSVR